MSKKLAIIDLGSNSIRMIIMKINENGSYKMVDQAKEMVRLSEGMGEEKTLKSSAMLRTINTLKLFKKLIESYKVDEIKCIATAAVRNSTNQNEFLQRIRNEVGLNFEVISGNMEAYYGYLGVINTIDINNCIIIDIGGGSTELILVKDRKPKKTISLPYGAVVLTEKFLEKGRDIKNSLKNIEEFIRNELDKIEWLRKIEKLPIVGLGGTIRTLAKIDKRRIGFPLDSLHNYNLTVEEVNEIYNEVTSKDIKQRKEIPGLGKERADIIIAGLVPLKCLIDKVTPDRLIISGNGLREGVFFKNYLETQNFNDDIVNDVLYHSVNNILKNYESNIKHCYHVNKLTLALFDELLELHNYGCEERIVLSVASLLHDIGMYVDYYNHHKHSFYLTLNSKIYGLRNRELVMCAFIAAMHRETDFKENWKKYNMLINKDDYQKIKKLSILLKIAEKLDRNEMGSVKDLKCIIDKKEVIISLYSDNTPELEISSAMKFEEEFKKLFKRKLSIVKNS